MRQAAFATFFALWIPSLAFGWGQPHHAITRGALEVLPAWQKEALGGELKQLGDSYCMIPDNVFTDKENAKYAKMESVPNEVYLKILHVPTQQAEYHEVMRYFMEKAVAAWREGRQGDAARYMGTMCHQIEDYGSPAHVVPGDNMFTLMQQLLPPSEAMKDQLMHGPIENGDFTVSIEGYKPALLGTTVNEAAWRLMHRVHEEIINSRSTTVPIMQALYREDKEGVVKHQLRAAEMDAKVVADAMYTVMCLGTGKVEQGEAQSCKEVQIGEFFPVEAASLYYPQSEFFSAPNWGHARSGVILAGGNKAMPLELCVGSGNQEFKNGISAGMGKALTFLLPKDVYARFRVLAGLHPELGAKGRVEFTVSGDGKVLASVTLNGTDNAQMLECDVSSVTELRLGLTSRGVDAKSNYAIWAEPTLVKP
ncbi:NPCBM/NEW2 domain-containing protein [Prosthecobacter sp.]|uniref:NPCBM/NEW2 domain-containing protein n=1 Tax=Prosthecobacter sp. TaxID=1965333 RepID=UPI003785199C